MEVGTGSRSDEEEDLREVTIVRCMRFAVEC